MHFSAVVDTKNNIAAEGGMATSYAVAERKLNRVIDTGGCEDYFSRMLLPDLMAEDYSSRDRIYLLYKELAELAESFDYTSYALELRKKFEVYCIFLVLVFKVQDQPPRHYDASRCPKFSLISKFGPSERGPPLPAPKAPPDSKRKVQNK